MRELSNTIEEGFQFTINQLPQTMKQYWQLNQDLTCKEGVPKFKGRAIIPTPLRKHVLAALHSAHQGTTSMKLRAERYVFWPGITKDIQTTRDCCITCCRTAPSQPQMPPSPSIVLAYLFQHVVMDYMELNGRTYGVFADRYSNWVGVHAGNGGSSTLISVMKQEFAYHGIT